MKGLIVKSPWIDKILSGEKPWEIRGNNTKIRGRIALIKSGTGKIYGTVELIDSSRLSYNDFFKNKDRHKIDDTGAYFIYNTPHAWVLSNAIRLDNPIPYNHPQGAVIWVNLPDDILKEIEDARSNKSLTDGT